MKKWLFLLAALSVGVAAVLYAVTAPWGRPYRARLTELLGQCGCTARADPGATDPTTDQEEAIKAKIAETRRRLREEIAAEPQAGSAA